MPERTLEQLEKLLTDHARGLAPVDRALGRRTLKTDEAELLFTVAGKLHARSIAAEAAGKTTIIGPEPRWVQIGRTLIGTREIPGPKHTGFIAQGWARLGAGWFNDDETPWCGFLAAHCMDAAGFSYPKGGLFARAKAWLDWGKPVLWPVLGAVAVFGREGGGHVGFAVGESDTNLYILGGNQSNMVSIAPIAKSRLLGMRWPLELPVSSVPLPRMSGGVVSRREQ